MQAWAIDWSIPRKDTYADIRETWGDNGERWRHHHTQQPQEQRRRTRFVMLKHELKRIRSQPIMRPPIQPPIRIGVRNGIAIWVIVAYLLFSVPWLRLVVEGSRMRFLEAILTLLKQFPRTYPHCAGFECGTFPIAIAADMCWILQSSGGTSQCREYGDVMLACIVYFCRQWGRHSDELFDMFTLENEGILTL